MEIYPRLFALMLARAFACGVCLCIFYELLRLLRVMTATEPKKSYQPRIAPQDERIVALCQAELPLPPPLSLYGRRSVPSLQYLCKNKLGRSHTVVCHILIFLSDVIFFSVTGVAISLILYYNNDGQLRLLVPIFTAVGFLSCYLTLGRLARRFAGLLSFLLGAVCTYITLLALFPLLCAYKLLLALLRITVLKLVAQCRLRKLRKDSDKKYGLLISASKHGFVDTDLMTYRS